MTLINDNINNELLLISDDITKINIKIQSIIKNNQKVNQEINSIKEIQSKNEILLNKYI